MMVVTTSGERRETPISREDILEQLSVLGVAEEINRGEKDEIHKAYIDGYVKAIRDAKAVVRELPVMNTAGGKKLVKRFYPRICVRGAWQKEGQSRQIGGNYYDQLRVVHGENSSYLAYLNMQAMLGTDFADEGYTFVGEHYPEEYGDRTEYIPFDEVWVEEKDDTSL